MVVYEDKSNNSISNLELIEKGRHIRHHWNDEKRKWASENCEKIRHLTKEWHGSPEGLAWHKYHAEKCKFGKWDPIKYNCKLCGSEYESSKRSNVKFCSNKCKSAWRRKEGLDNIIRKCEKCDNEFSTNKYKKRKYCSHTCYP